MKKIVEFYITTKRELKFQLEFTDFQYNDWLENQLDSDIEQLIHKRTVHIFKDGAMHTK